MVSKVPAKAMFDGEGHGSHVAALIAGNANGSGVTGVAPRASIIPIGLTIDPYMPDSQFNEMAVAGIDLAVEEGAEVINLSFGAYAPDVCAAVERAISSDVVVVAAAGNDGHRGNPRLYPAACPNVVSVAATSSQAGMTYWSSFDSTVTISAPGEDLLSALPRSSDGAVTAGYGPMSGTSMASPVVAGVAALVRAAHPEWSASQVVDALTASAADAGAPGWDPEFGAGIVDALAAVSGSTGSVTRVASFAPSLGYGGMLSWRPVQGATTTGYTLRRFFGEDVAEESIAADQVRWGVVDLLPGEWVQLIAHTTTGDVLSFPVLGRPEDPVVRPDPTGLRISRLSDGSVKVSWRQPKGSSEWSVDLQDPRGLFYTARYGSGYGPQQVVFQLAEEPGLESTVLEAVVTSQFADGTTTQAASRRLAPLQLLRIDAAEAAGARFAVVAGAVVEDDDLSKIGPRCKGTCAGQVVSVYGLNGKKLGSARVTSSGSFKVVVPRAARADWLRLSARLDSFPKMNTGHLRFVMVENRSA